jgi:hypothetical protein
VNGKNKSVFISVGWRPPIEHQTIPNGKEETRPTRTRDGFSSGGTAWLSLHKLTRLRAHPGRLLLSERSHRFGKKMGFFPSRENSRLIGVLH